MSMLKMIIYQEKQQNSLLKRLIKFTITNMIILLQNKELKTTSQLLSTNVSLEVYQIL